MAKFKKVQEAEAQRQKENAAADLLRAQNEKLQKEEAEAAIRDAEMLRK